MTYFDIGQILTGRGTTHAEAIEKALLTALPEDLRWDFSRLTQGLRVEVLWVEAEVSIVVRLIVRLKVIATDNVWGK